MRLLYKKHSILAFDRWDTAALKIKNKSWKDIAGIHLKIDSDKTYLKLRDIGVGLGYGSRGGNLTHHIRGKYVAFFKENTDYVMLSGTIWMTYDAVLVLLALVGREGRDGRGRGAYVMLAWMMRHWGYV